MEEITIDKYKQFLFSYNQGSRLGIARAFSKEFNVKNKDLLEMLDDDIAQEYIFKKYLLH